MDRWPDMTKLIVAFRNFANAPENQHLSVENVAKREKLQLGIQKADTDTRNFRTDGPDKTKTSSII